MLTWVPEVDKSDIKDQIAITTRRLSQTAIAQLIRNIHSPMITDVHVHQGGGEASNEIVAHKIPAILILGHTYRVPIEVTQITLIKDISFGIAL